MEIIRSINKLRKDIKELKEQLELTDKRTIQTDYKETKLNEELCKHINNDFEILKKKVEEHINNIDNPRRV